MPDLTDVAVAAFVALLVFGGLYVPRVADAIGRRLRPAGSPPPEGRERPPGGRSAGGA